MVEGTGVVLELLVGTGVVLVNTPDVVVLVVGAGVVLVVPAVLVVGTGVVLVFRGVELDELLVDNATVLEELLVVGWVELVVAGWVELVVTGCVELDELLVVPG